MRIRLALAFAFLSASIPLAPLAFAQDAPAPAPAPAPEAPKAGESKEAQEHFQRARTLYDEGDFNLALIEFKRAYDISPNYRVLYNIGQVNIQLFNYAAARKALEQYLEDGGSEISSGRKAQVEADLKMLRERTAYLNVVTKPPAVDVAIDDVPAGHAPFREPLVVNAGQRRVTVSKQGFVSVTKYLTLAGGDRQDVSIELAPAGEGKVVVVGQARTEKNYTPAIVGWTATGGLAITAVVLGAVALGKKSELDDLSNPSNLVTPQGKRDAEASANTFSLATDIFAVAALVGAAVSVYFTLRPPMTTTTEAPAKPPAVSFSPFGVHGVF
jgi:hypothetical protein